MKHFKFNPNEAQLHNGAAMIRLQHDIGEIRCSLKGNNRVGQRNRIVSFHAVKIGCRRKYVITLNSIFLIHSCFYYC